MILPALLQAVAQLTVADSVTSAPKDMRFQAGYAMTKYGTWAVEFYVRDASSETEWIVRRSLVTDDGREQVRWLVESDCPAVRGVVAALATTALGSIRAPDPGRPNSSATADPHPTEPGAQDPLAEAPLYTVWGVGLQPDGSPVDYSISAISGGVAGWGEMAEKTLTPCWTARSLGTRSTQSRR